MDTEKFTTLVRKNKAPSKAGEPLTVNEFCLMPGIKQDLKKAFDDYRRWKANFSGKQLRDPAIIEVLNNALGDIIENHMPREILAELEAIKIKGGATSTVFIINNLPEIENIEPELLPLQEEDNLERYINKNAYTNLIQEGIANYLKLHIKGNSINIPRFSGSPKIPEGTGTHKDAEEVTMMGGVRSNGAGTLITDMGAVMSEVHTIPNTKMPEVKVTIHRGQRKTTDKRIRLDELDEYFPGWQENQEIFILPITHKDKFKELILKHSQKITVEQGGLAIWVQDGHLFHQAMVKEDPNVPIDQLIRYIVINTCERTLQRQ